MNKNSLNIANKKLVWFAVACVLVVNAAILGKVFFNRAQVTASLQLSERELQLPYNYGFKKEDSSKRLSLRWKIMDSRPDAYELDKWGWSYEHKLHLSDAHLSSFHFSSCDKTNHKNNHKNNKKSAWVLLELNGQSYADYVTRVEKNYTRLQDLQPQANTELTEKALQKRREDAQQLLAAAKNTDSRLFIIDAAAERELLETALRARQAINNTTLVIVPAELQADYNRCDDPTKKSTAVRVNNLAVESLYIPKDFTQGLTLDSSSHFTADIHYGRLNEPWIANLTSCEKECL